MRPAAVSINRRLTHWQSWAAVVWGLALLVVCVRVVLMPGSRSVYGAYEQGGQHWRTGEDLYLAYGGYRYSPPATVFFAALSYLPLGMGEMAWRLLSAAAFLAGLGWWGRACLPRALTGSEYGLLYLLVAPLTFSSLNNGQANLLLIGTLLVGVAATARGRWNVATACLVLACLLKAYPAAIALLLLVLYPRRLGWRLAVGLLIGVALPFLFQTSDYVCRQYANWWRNLHSDDRTGWPLEMSYRDAWLLCRLCQAPLSLTAYRIIQLTAAAAVAGLCLAGQYAGWKPRRVLTTLFGLGCCWMMLFGPATESSTYALLAPSLAWAVLAAWLERPAIWLRAGTAVSFALLAGAFVAAWFPIGPQVHTLGPHPLGALVLLGCLVAGALVGLKKAPAEADQTARPAQAA